MYRVLRSHPNLSLYEGSIHTARRCFDQTGGLFCGTLVESSHWVFGRPSTANCYETLARVSSFVVGFKQEGVIVKSSCFLRAGLLGDTAGDHWYRRSFASSIDQRTPRPGHLFDDGLEDIPDRVRGHLPFKTTLRAWREDEQGFIVSWEGSKGRSSVRLLTQTRVYLVIVHGSRGEIIRGPCKFRNRGRGGVIACTPRLDTGTQCLGHA
ncbi:hypothetical protein VNO77_02545 [Canavalia gladiata]|uniref:Uncharacterized protein n=1 Tax=Canavalia gladiata TaxID=3824 RepID=A0AAN9MTY9_CANGL